MGLIYLLYIFTYSCVIYTDMRRLTMGIRSVKCVFMRFRRLANVIECTYTKLDSNIQSPVNLHAKTSTAVSKRC